VNAIVRTHGTLNVEARKWATRAQNYIAATAAVQPREAASIVGTTEVEASRVD